jgi:hypothetical protein
MSGRKLLIGGGVLWALSAVAFGRPAPVINLVWSNVAPGVRQYVESKYGLTDGYEVSDGKWAYALRDTSEENRRALANHVAVSGIEGIDPRTFDLADRLPRAPWRRGWLPVPEPLARAVELAALLAMLVGAAILWAPGAVASTVSRSRGVATAVTKWVQRGIPEASPEAAAAFRIVFGTLVVAFFASERVYPELLTPLEIGRASGPYGAAVHWLTGHPEVVASLQSVLTVTGVLFVAGAATRMAFACFTAAALVWTTVFTLNISTHAVAAVAMTLLALLPARWSDAWSVDAWLRRRRGALRHTPARAYGYAFWVPGFVLAVAFAAAAWSKVREGPAWILNGTVKYHFVSDLEHAWVSWGPALTRWHAVAVAMCVFAVLVETLLITSMFSRSYWYRAALGVMALLLLVGFALFQGIVWLGWWVLLLAFLPWHLIASRGSESNDRPRPSRIPGAQFAAVVLVVVQQLIVTGMHVEARPMFSSYDMYSTTYASWADYEAASNLTYRVVAVSDGRSADVPGCTVDDTVAAIARRALEGSERDLQLLQWALRGCLRSKPDVQQIALEGDRQVFLRNESRFAWKRRLDVIGPIDADRLRD